MANPSVKCIPVFKSLHYNDVIMSATASQITSLTIVYSTFYAGADQRKHHSSASLAFVMGIHRWPVNFPHKGPVTRKMFPFDDVIMDGCAARQAEAFKNSGKIIMIYINTVIEHRTTLTCVFDFITFNSLAPGSFEWKLRWIIFKLTSVIDVWGISCEITHRCML